MKFLFSEIFQDVARTQLDVSEAVVRARKPYFVSCRMVPKIFVSRVVCREPKSSGVSCRVVPKKAKICELSDFVTQRYDNFHQIFCNLG